MSLAVLLLILAFLLGGLGLVYSAAKFLLVLAVILIIASAITGGSGRRLW